jgi:hypothetical protein
MANNTQKHIDDLRQQMAGILRSAQLLREQAATAEPGNAYLPAARRVEAAAENIGQAIVRLDKRRILTA